jgi:hypothetical protein
MGAHGLGILKGDVACFDIFLKVPWQWQSLECNMADL